MKINEIYLRNFRCFEELSIVFDPLLTIFVGDNGSGKTAILDAITIAFGRLLTKLPNLKGLSLKDNDIRIIEYKKKSAFVRYSMSTLDFKGDPVKWTAHKKRDSSPKTANEAKFEIAGSQFDIVGFKHINEFANSLIDSHNDDVPFKMPLIVYYGTSRAIVDEVKRRRNFRKNFSRFDSLDGALEPDARFRAAFEWFNAMEDEERREQQAHRDYNFSLPSLNTVRNAISSMLRDFENPRTETKPFRFVIDRKNEDGSSHTLRISQLSDGYRTMLGLVMDLARRMAEANPPDSNLGHDSSWDVKNPLHMPAIVLIDEIDLHLHPQWQQRVVTDLQRTFPNTQFILTTHSPQVLSTVRRENIRVIGQNTQGISIAEPPLAMTYGEPSGDVMHSVMLVDPQPPVSEKADLHRLTELVDQGLYSSQEAVRLMERLQAALHEKHPQLLRLRRSIQRQEALKG
jgi:predicted ATP-binding protein involved in virulence